MSNLVLVAALLYGLNLLIGVAAQSGRVHLGRAHHLFYFVVFSAAGVATLFAYQPALLVTLGALALMPRVRAGGWRHPLLAATGACGYLLAFTRYALQ